MAVINKNNTTNRTLTSTGCWEGGVVPGAADIARWYSASNAGGNHTGSLTVLGLQVDGATADISYTSGTLTLTQTDAFVNGTSNNRRFVLNGGTMALGAGNRTLALYNANTGNACITFASNTLTGSGTVALVNVVGAPSQALNAWVAFVTNGTGAAFTGTFVLNDLTAIGVGVSGTAVLPNANVEVSGNGCLIAPVNASGDILGASGKSLTVNNDVSLGFAARTWTIAYAVVLAGTGTRTLTVNSNTDITGTVTGSNGVSVNVTDSTLAARLLVAGVSSGLSGPCVVSGNRLVFGQALTANRYAPSSLTINAGAEFGYNRPTEDFNFPTAPTGSGCIAITGSLAGTGCTFPAGLLDSFDGRLVAWPSSNAGLDNLVKMVIHQVAAGGLEWRSNVPTATTNTARFTYANAANVDGSFPLLLDTYANTTPATLLTSEYSLIVPSSSGTFKTSGTVTRQNSIGGTSARMDLSLGGTNTGDNTLSGNISEIGTNSATLGIKKIDAGRWVLSGTNTHTGVHTISAGTLSAQSAAALGAATSTGGVAISGTGVLELAGGITLNKSVTDFTVSNATNPVQSVGDNTLQTKQLTLSVTPTFTVGSGDKLTLAPQGAGVIFGSGTGITKAGDGELALGNTNNTFTGAVAVNAGTLTVHNVFSQGAAQNLGQSSTAIPLAGTLKFIGTSGFMNRSLTLTGPTPALDCSGSGNFEFQNATQTNEARTFTLTGTSTGVNEVKFALGDTSFATGLAKDGTGNWTVSGALSYSGATDVNEGTLRLARADGNTMTGAVTVDAGATLELVTDTLPGSSGAAGRVLGTGNVTVNGDVKTRGGVVQKGQMRYGGNLTFGSGSKLYIGAAA